MNSMRVILASASPRRQELIKKITGDFEILSTDVDEEGIERRLIEQGGYSCEAELAERVVRSLSLAKASASYLNIIESIYEKDTATQTEELLVIGADTIVCLSGEILGKPKDRADAVRMLRAQSLEPQRVITGVTLIYKKTGKSEPLIHTFSEESLVFFKPLDAAQEARIQAYCGTDEPYDKAGGYGIQLGGVDLVDHYEGDYENIIGFPVARVSKEIELFTGCKLNKLT